MVDDLDSSFFLVRAVTHAGTAAEAQGLAVLHSRSAEIFGAAADADFGTDRQEFDDVVRANRSAFAATRAERLVDDRQAIFTHAHSAERAGTRAVAEAETAELTEFRTLLDDFSSRAVMNTFVFISQFGNAIAAAAFDVSIFRFRSFSDFARQFSDDSSDFSFTRNTEVRRNVRVEDDGFRIFCTTGETAGTALALRKCFFYFADERVFFHGKLLISTCKDKAEDDTDAGHDNDGHDCNERVIHNLIPTPLP